MDQVTIQNHYIHLDKLSIDKLIYTIREGRMLGWGNFLEDKEKVQEFLDRVHGIIRAEEFDPYRDINYCLRSIRQKADDPNTNENTLSRLDYDKSDMAQEVLQLTPSNYEKTCVDQEPRLPNNYCFYKKIQGEDIIIKFREEDHGIRRLFFPSFHSADRPIDLNDYKYWDSTSGEESDE